MKTTKKQTAVEWLISAISFDNDGKKEFVYNDSYDLSKLFNKAKKMEKQQIIDALNKTYFNSELIRRSIENKNVFSVGEQYYYETYEI